MPKGLWISPCYHSSTQHEELYYYVREHNPELFLEIEIATDFNEYELEEIISGDSPYSYIVVELPGDMNILENHLSDCPKDLFHQLEKVVPVLAIRKRLGDGTIGMYKPSIEEGRGVNWFSYLITPDRVATIHEFVNNWHSNKEQFGNPSTLSVSPSTNAGSPQPSLPIDVDRRLLLL